MIPAMIQRAQSTERPEGFMSRLTIGTILLILLCIVGESAAHAARYCLQGQRWGFPGNCSFATRSQCLASASGTRAHCGINPRYAHQRRGQSH